MHLRVDHENLTHHRELAGSPDGLKTKPVPTPVLTGDPNIEARREALLCGANDFVSKPYDGTEVLARVGNLLEVGPAGRSTAAEAMRESEERFAGAFEHAPIGMALVAPEGRFLMVNRVLCELVGYSEADLLERTFQDITHRDDLESDMENVRQMLAGEIRSYEMEKRYVHAGGHAVTVCLNVSLVRDAEGRPLYFVSHVQDITERKRAEEELRWTTALLEAQMNSSLDGILVVDPEGKKILKNERLADLLKVPQHIADNEDDEGQVQWVASTTKNPEHFTARVRHLENHPDETGRDEIELKDGTVLDRYSAPVIGKDGRYYGRIRIFRDITDQRRAEDSIRLQAHILDNVGQAVLATDPAGQVTYANRFAQELYGWPAAEILGQNIMDVTVPKHSRAQAEEIMEQLQRGESWSGEFYVRDRSGREFPACVTTTTLRGENGAVIGIIGVSEDNTERKRTQEELFQSRQTLRGILDHFPQRVFWKDRDLVYQGCNHAFAMDMGFNDPSEIIGKTDFDTRFKAMAELYRADDRRVIDLNAPKVSFEEPALDSQGHPAWIKTSKVPLHDQQGRVTGILGTYEDVTQHKHAKLEIERLNADLEQRVAERTEALFAATQEAERANRAKSEFLSRTSHELRTPMNAILGFGQLLELEENLGPEPRESVEQILHAGRHLLALINEVLDISNAESGSMTLSLEPVAVDRLFEETLGLVRPLGSVCRVELAMCPLVTGGCRVLADPQRLKQVLLNLLSNAIKYNHPGGSVKVETRLADTSHPPALRFCVRDTGPGISAENLKRLFTPFDRLDAERTQTHITGTGLGLALAKRMVELMGGRLGVESIVGEGSTFWLELPLAESLPTSTRERAPDFPAEVPGEAAPTKVLYIQENVSQLRMITRILARRPSIELRSALTGAQGLQLARDLHPALIVLDRFLPDGDAQGILAQLGGDPATAAIPVVILAPVDLPRDRAGLLSAGASAVLARPVDVRALLAIVDQSLGQRP